MLLVFILLVIFMLCPVFDCFQRCVIRLYLVFRCCVFVVIPLWPGHHPNHLKYVWKIIALQIIGFRIEHRVHIFYCFGKYVYNSFHLLFDLIPTEAKFSNANFFGSRPAYQWRAPATFSILYVCLNVYRMQFVNCVWQSNCKQNCFKWRFHWTNIDVVNNHFNGISFPKH